MKHHIYIALSLAYYDRTYFIVVPAFSRSCVTSALLSVFNCSYRAEILGQSREYEFSNVNEVNVRLPVNNNSEQRMTSVSQPEP